MTYFILQSVEQADIAFHIADPTQFGFSYEISLSAEEEQNLQLDKPEDAAVMVMLYREGGVADAPIRANLNAPLVLNPKARRCIQHRFAKLSYDLANATESTP